MFVTPGAHMIGLQFDAIVRRKRWQQSQRGKSRLPMNRLLMLARVALQLYGLWVSPLRPYSLQCELQLLLLSWDVLLGALGRLRNCCDVAKGRGTASNGEATHQAPKRPQVRYAVPEARHCVVLTTAWAACPTCHRPTSVGGVVTKGEHGWVHDVCPVDVCALQAAWCSSISEAQRT